MPLDLQPKNAAELIATMEAEMKELRQIEALESQIRELAVRKRERVLELWKATLPVAVATSVSTPSPDVAPSTASTLPAAITEPSQELAKAADTTKESAPPRAKVNLPARPYGTPGAPRDLLTESGVSSKNAVGNGASALVNGDTAKRAPSAQQVFQSLNRLVGGNKNQPLKN